MTKYYCSDCIITKTPPNYLKLVYSFEYKNIHRLRTYDRAEKYYIYNGREKGNVINNTNIQQKRYIEHAPSILTEKKKGSRIKEMKMFLTSNEYNSKSSDTR